MRGGTIAEPREVCQLCRTEASVCGGGRPRGASFLCKLHPLFVQNNGLEVLLVSIRQFFHAAWVLYYVRKKIIETQHVEDQELDAQQNQIIQRLKK